MGVGSGGVRWGISEFAWVVYTRAQTCHGWMNRRTDGTGLAKRRHCTKVHRPPKMWSLTTLRTMHQIFPN